MNGVNKVILIGNLGDDPEMRHFENGGAVCKLSIATTEKYKDKQGNKQENVEWHRVELNDNLAKVAEQYLKKGDSVYIEGKLKKDSWEDKEGNKRSLVKVRGFVMNMLGSPKGQSEQSQQPEQPQSDNSGGGVGDGATGDLPFRRTPDKMMFKNKWF